VGQKAPQRWDRKRRKKCAAYIEKKQAFLGLQLAATAGRS